jgi:L(+)-tartrate dehydratase alpha subunit
VVGDRNPDPKIAALEAEFTELGNNIGMGAMGFVGSSMVIDCNIEVGYCHTGVACRCLCMRFVCPRAGRWRGSMPMGSVEYPHRPGLGSPPISAARQSNGKRQ